MKNMKLFVAIIYVVYFLFGLFFLIHTRNVISTGPGFLSKCTCYPSDHIVSIIKIISDILSLAAPLVGLIVLLISKTDYLKKSIIAAASILFVYTALIFTVEYIHNYENGHQLSYECECKTK